jgi:hypothetical protein
MAQGLHGYLRAFHGIFQMTFNLHFTVSGMKLVAANQGSAEFFYGI